MGIKKSTNPIFIIHMENGAPANKITFGMPLYGQAFTNPQKMIRSCKFSPGLVEMGWISFVIKQANLKLIVKI